MAETLGSLCDKLTIVVLKKFHTDSPEKLESLNTQETQLREEIDEFVSNAVNGVTPESRLTFKSNKIYAVKGNEIGEVYGDIGAVFSELAKVNCDLWHEQERVYTFSEVPVEEKDKVVKQLALLNLSRNACIDKIDSRFKDLIQSRKFR